MPPHRKLRPSLHSSHRASRMASLDLEPAQLDFLSQPSPYHDDFSLPNTPVSPRSPSSSNAFSSLFRRFRYQRVDSGELPRVRICEGQDEESPMTNFATEPGIDQDFQDWDGRKGKATDREKHVHWQELETTQRRDGRVAGRWFTSVFLLLLLSGLINLFLIFNGPPPTLRHPMKTDDPLPLHGSRYEEYGKNYTFYETRSGIFRPDADFQNVKKEYDYIWDELMPASKGYVYTNLGRSDAKIRKARFGMFTQLECLAKIRKVIQALANGSVIQRGKADGEADWERCFGYLGKITLCNADDSLEISRIADGIWQSDMFGQARQCRSPTRLFDITDCGLQGCEGKPFYHTDEEMKSIETEEQADIETWVLDHDTHL